jgi:hypothetical protein
LRFLTLHSVILLEFSQGLCNRCPQRHAIPNRPFDSGDGLEILFRESPVTAVPDRDSLHMSQMPVTPIPQFVLRDTGHSYDRPDAVSLSIVRTHKMFLLIEFWLRVW